MKKNYDKWHTEYYSGASFVGQFDMPVIKGTDEMPHDLIRFSDSRDAKRDNPDAWVVPYEHDRSLERVWNHALYYMPGLLEHPGIVSWDFSMYRNMPFSLQQWNCFRGRLIGNLYERHGKPCIPNVRPADPRSFAYSFDGLPAEKTISMGTLGAITSAEDRSIFKMYVDEVVRRLHPSGILVYGKAPEEIFCSALDAEIPVVAFPTQTSLAFSSLEEND